MDNFKIMQDFLQLDGLIAGLIQNSPLFANNNTYKYSINIVQPLPALRETSHGPQPPNSEHRLSEFKIIPRRDFILARAVNYHGLQ